MCELTLGERFKDARTVYNKHGTQKQQEVANAIGVSKSMICDLEDDEKSRGVSHLVVIKLAKHYGVSLDWLLGLSSVRTIDTSIQAICSYTGLNEESVSTLHKYVDSLNGTCLYDGMYNDYLEYNLDAVCDFISFLEQEYRLYYRFRQQNNGHQAFVSQFDTMTLSESTVLLALNTFKPLISQDRPENSCTLSCRDAADFFRTAFCDEFKDYLKAKYPLADPIAAIKAKYPLDKPSADTKED